MGSVKAVVMTPTQVNFSISPRGPIAGVGGWVGKSGKFGISHGKGEWCVVHAGVNMCGSAHSCGCVVNGSFARVIRKFILHTLASGGL